MEGHLSRLLFRKREFPAAPPSDTPRGVDGAGGACGGDCRTGGAAEAAEEAEEAAEAAAEEEELLLGCTSEPMQPTPAGVR